MPNLDDLMEYLIVTNQVDETFGLKPTCPSCGEPLEKSGDIEYPYYCPNCGKKFDDNLNEKEPGQSYGKRRGW
jgi:predicted amidophosphoribosyltransferase